MIPKKIHYCWVGGNPKPKSVIYCINSWKKYCPDYEIIEWNENNYDFHKNRYMAEAYDEKKWGFVPDYARLDIVYQHGGIYLDTDVELIKNLNELLNQEGFIGFEETGLDSYYVNCGQGFGAEQFNKSIKILRDAYNNIEFKKGNGDLNLIASPHYTTRELKKMGLVQENYLQHLPHLTVYKTDVLCPKNYRTGKLKITRNTIAIHHFTASWMDQKVVKEIAHNQKIINIYGPIIGKGVLLAESVFNKYGMKTFSVIPKKIIQKSKKKVTTLCEYFPYYQGLKKITHQKIGTQNIVILDTAQGSDNQGDEIIMDCCRKELNNLIDFSSCFHIATHRYPTLQEEAILKKASAKILCGTNILAGDMMHYGLWKLKPDISPYRNVILMGVGWNSKETDFTMYTKKMLRAILDPVAIHSVRDSFSEKQLRSIGISNVLNTGCPTMWHITPMLCEKISVNKAHNVVCTLTDYNKDPTQDSCMLEVLCKSYDCVYFWPQGEKDLRYLAELGFQNKVMLLSHSLESYDLLLKRNDDLDYVGTRLHAGIRAISKGHRSLIVAIDNRADCISEDTGLNIIERENLSLGLNDLINGELLTDIHMPFENIRKWKEQFKITN